MVNPERETNNGTPILIAFNTISDVSLPVVYKILSVGSIEKRPVVKETDFGDAVFIRHMLYLTLGYDHRLIDGAYGTKFLSRIKQLLENFNENEIIV